MKKSKLGKKYGWIPQLKDSRDYKYKVSNYFTEIPLPSSVDLRSVDSPILNQLDLGSCTGNGIAGCINFIHKSNNFLASRLFIYFGERQIEGTIDQDAGANIRDGIKFVSNTGVCSETTWPYDVSKFTNTPSTAAYTEASNDIVTVYLALNSLSDIKHSLASGFPVVFGTTLYESFESPEVASTGVVPMPTSSESVIGGHCMKIVGYIDTNSWFIVANSWGTDWADKGYCYIPYEFMQENGSDYWTIRQDTESTPSVAPGVGGSAV